MSTIIEVESTLTDRYQTTVPEAIRRALHLQKRSKIFFRVYSNGKVEMINLQQEKESDPVLGHFLNFLAQDIKHHPQRIESIDDGYVQRLRKLTAHVKVDLTAPLSCENE